MLDGNTYMSIDLLCHILPKSGNYYWKVRIENYFRPFKDDSHCVDFSSNQSINQSNGKIVKATPIPNRIEVGGKKAEQIGPNFICILQ